MGKPFVRDLLEACRLAAFPKGKKLLYERKIMNEMDIIAQRKYAHKTGVAEGIAKGEMSKARDGGCKTYGGWSPYGNRASCMGLSLDELRTIAESM